MEIGDILKDEKRDVVIIDKRKIKGKDGWNTTYYKYRCNKCGFDCGEHYHVIKKESFDECWISGGNMIKQGCACCCHNPQVVVKGINDILSTRPDIACLFADKEDLYKYTFGTSRKPLLKCPNCGTTKNVCLSNITTLDRLFPCDFCGDNISVPEKIMGLLLREISKNYNISFEVQFTKRNEKWCGKYKYDFFILYKNKRIIIETHGLQHYEVGFERIKEGKSKPRTLEEEKINDMSKMKLAIANGINDYIVIDCRHSSFEYIKDNIINSKLSKIFNLDDIDWEDLYIKAQKSLMIEACFLRREYNLTVAEISNRINIGISAVREYLIRGNLLGLCIYNGKDEMVRLGKNRVPGNTKNIEIWKDDVLIREILGAEQLSRESIDIFGENKSPAVIRTSIKENKSVNGFVLKYKKSKNYNN